MNTHPRCPKCGTPARAVLVQKAWVRYVLNADGSIGPVLSASREKPDPVGFECSGGHTWKPQLPIIDE